MHIYDKEAFLETIGNITSLTYEPDSNVVVYWSSNYTNTKIDGEGPSKDAAMDVLYDKVKDRLYDMCLSEEKVGWM